nr:uncharacterized protein LOC132598370 isoform X6 [Globicephala melas]
MKTSSRQLGNKEHKPSFVISEHLDEAKVASCFPKTLHGAFLVHSLFSKAQSLVIPAWQSPIQVSHPPKLYIQQEGTGRWQEALYPVVFLVQ